ncbi:MAG: tripartite tricarboxylate transporter substrate binding protein [Betaproteobacteria bacterium]|nr:tripartite tricarboxylate transporter substrate binding protein [Betaproteobacteria bacterium]
MNRILTRALTALALLCCGAPASAQPYPSKTIRIVIPFPAGGSTDFLARQLSDRMQESMAQPVIVDNRPGGNYVIAAEAVAKAPPDGYMLFMAVDAAMSVNQLLYSKLPYSPDKDFAPISQVGGQPLFIVASARAPARNFRELMTYAKANPGKVSFGTSSQLHLLAGEKIKMDLPVDMLNIPFKGSPPMLQALLTSEIDISITAITPYANYVKDGRLFGLAVTSPNRAVLLPDTPTVRELGFPELEFSNWFGLYAPAGTPKAILDRLNAEVRKALADPTARQRLITAGFDPVASTPEHLATLIKADLARFASIIKAAGLKVN